MFGNPEDEALNKIIGDMDDMESKRMFGGNDKKGVSITISVMPNGDEGSSDMDSESSPEDYEDGHDIGLCKGGCAYHKGGEVQAMALGGEVNPAKEAPEEDDKKLPPFLRKKKKPLQDA